MKEARWRSPEAASGLLLSRKWVQTFVFELPDLSPAELKSSLRYKVQAILPVNTDEFVFHTQLFHHKKKKYGAAFLAPPSAAKAFPHPARDLRVGVPLVLPPGVSSRALLFVATPEGLSPHLYENGVLKTSFAPLDARDQILRKRLTDQFPDIEIVALAPDRDVPLPFDLRERQLKEALRDRTINAFPLWDPPQPSRLPGLAGSLLAAGGLVLIGMTLLNSWSLRQQRNDAWKSWLRQNETAGLTLSQQDKLPILLKAQGVPVPELFVHLAAVWGDQTKILDLEWSQNKLTLTAESPSALLSLRKLTADPWFKNIKVNDIRTQKNGREAFTIEGGLSLDR